jgi:hypothetical protein
VRAECSEGNDASPDGKRTFGAAPFMMILRPDMGRALERIAKAVENR